MSFREYLSIFISHVRADAVTLPGVAFLFTLIGGYGARSKAARKWMLNHPSYLGLVALSRWMERNDRWIFRGLLGLAAIVLLFLYGYVNYLTYLDVHRKWTDAETRLTALTTP